MSGRRVVVGMSGGVDSSVAAYLLKEAGYEVIGVTMQIWQQEDPLAVEEKGGCCGLSAVEDAREVAADLGIPYYVMNFREDFQKHVITYFIEDYLAGKTPNPCIACNRYVKWESLLQRALSIGADYIATGHYARIARLENGRYSIRNSVTAKKDQTYALYNLTQDQLSRTLMPIGEYEKEEVRAIADRAGLPVAQKPDSMEICFVPDQNYAGFIDRSLPQAVPEGNFVTRGGKILGKHKGITHYTIGQRKGLNLAMGHPVFVTELRPETNEVVIGESEELFTNSLLCDHLNFMSLPDLTEDRKALVKIRYNHAGTPAILHRISKDQIQVIFEEPVRAATPGQACVFYDGEYILGGGTICRN